MKRFRERAEEEKQAGIQGQWQLESPAKENLEQVKSCDDTDCTQRMMKQGFIALKSGDWEEYKSIFRDEVKATEWAFDRIQEAFEQVAQDEARKLSTVQDIMIRSAGYLRRIIAPAGGHGGVTMSYFSLWKTTFGGSLGEKSIHIGGAQFVEKNTTGSNQTGSWLYKQVKV